MNQFGRLFRRCRRTAGATVTFLEAQDDTQEVERAHNAVIAANEAVTNEEIAHADTLLPEEADLLRNNEIRTREERNALIKYKLVECYRVPPDGITAGFVGKYNEPGKMSVFHNLNRLAEDNIAASIEAWRQYRKTPDTSMDDLNRGDNMLKCMFAVDVLNTLMPVGNRGQYTREFKTFHKRFVARVSLEHTIDAAVKILQDHADVVSLAFGMRRDRLMQARVDLKSQLQLINSVLNATFGVKLVGSQRVNGVPMMFALNEPKDFTWNGTDGRYIVPAREYALMPDPADQ
eukprot:TRINITY_DN386_c1_g1_i1.p2 TRINITY_DN386_c1_g1~~TRINITY_DN386_c1_g1_i1.p2  ORF type:complete len:290 (-),score=21.85 TRINITY_DN386_c1_g1_i1:2032-2901(-)